MGYWKSPQELGLNEAQITEILEKLWQKDKSTASRKCPDCGVQPGEQHVMNCDVARCTICGRQALLCDCEEPIKDVWDGLWPGTKECYEKRLIAFGGGSWTFDYNTLAVLKAKEN